MREGPLAELFRATEAAQRQAEREAAGETSPQTPEESAPVEPHEETVEHVRDVQLLLSEARRVLRPGGRLAVSTPAHSRLTGLDILVRGFDRRFPSLSPHLRFLTRRSLHALLDDLGFEPGPIRRSHGTLLAVAVR